MTEEVQLLDPWKPLLVAPCTSAAAAAAVAATFVTVVVAAVAEASLVPVEAGESATLDAVLAPAALAAVAVAQHLLVARALHWRS